MKLARLHEFEFKAWHMLVVGVAAFVLALIGEAAKVVMAALVVL